MRGRFKVLPILLFILFGAVYYFSNLKANPYTGRRQLITMSKEDEAALGLQSFKQILNQEQVVNVGQAAELVRRVGQRIAKVAKRDDFEWEFVLVESSQINAFCLPGGKVVVFSGILPVAKNEDGLAVIMGHEVAHALSHHGAERMAQQQLAQFGQLALGMATGEMDYEQRRMIMGAFGMGSQFGILLPFSRKHESEADEIGLTLMAEACFNPDEAVNFWQRMGEVAESVNKPPEFMSTHPSDDTRVVQLESWLPKAREIRTRYCNLRGS